MIRHIREVAGEGDPRHASPALTVVAYVPRMSWVAYINDAQSGQAIG